MTSSRHIARRSRGFTLMELMIVVAIVGVLSSIAIPSFGLMLVRAKTSERAVIMGHIKKGVADLYLRNGSIPDGLTGAWTPSLPATTVKRTPNWNQAGWDQVLSQREIDGPTFYSYFFFVWETATPPQLLIWARGDLDGDGISADKTILYGRIGGVYEVLAESSNPEDLGIY